jgi:hypothetical protein
MGEVLYRPVNKTLRLEFCDTFFVHLSPHQFGVVVKGGCKVVIHNVRVDLDVHLDWVVLSMDVVNALNTILKRSIF